MNNVEEFIYKEIEKTLSQYDAEMNDKGISYDLSFNHHGSQELYFSEFEATFWKDDNVLDEICVIIYIEGKKRNEEGVFISWFKDELTKLIAAV